MEVDEEVEKRLQIVDDFSSTDKMKKKMKVTLKMIMITMTMMMVKLIIQN